MKRSVALFIAFLHAFFLFILISCIPLMALGPKYGCHITTRWAYVAFWVNPVCSVAEWLSEPLEK